jgi:hypothetical protein
MSQKKLGAALLVVVVLGAIAASGAYAENEFKGGGTWIVSGAKLAEGTEKQLLTAWNGAPFTLTTTVGEAKLKLSSPNISCLSLLGANCRITNKSGTVATVQADFISFTEAKVVEPSGCTLMEGQVVTKALVATLGMGGNGTGATLKFVPASGTTLAVVVLTGGSCPLAGTYKITGTVFAEMANATGVSTKTQEVKFSEAIQKSAGTGTSLAFGANPAILNGGIKATLTSGESWGGQE